MTIPIMASLKKDMACNIATRTENSPMVTATAADNCNSEVPSGSWVKMIAYKGSAKTAIPIADGNMTSENNFKLWPINPFVSGKSCVACRSIRLGSALFASLASISLFSSEWVAEITAMEVEPMATARETIMVTSLLALAPKMAYSLIN